MSTQPPTTPVPSALPAIPAVVPAGTVNLLAPEHPGAAYDAFVASSAALLRDRPAWQEGDAPMPALYVSHGAPPVFDDPRWIAQLAHWSASLPKPRAILIVSAHWESAPMLLSATGPATPLVYDFGGFAARYFRMTYATPDASWLADRVARLMPDTEPVHVHASRGLDHGAWVPLKVMEPGADVPVLQLSMPTHDPERLLRLGARLRPLRDEGVLIIGSGYMTHGLPYLDVTNMALNHVPGWSLEFDAWAAEALARGAVDELSDFTRAPGMPYAHPTVEHYMPLFVALGAASDASVAPRTVIDDFQMGLAKRSLEFA
jgi:4,5-DOPA dioxygenase extradiol